MVEVVTKGLDQVTGMRFVSVRQTNTGTRYATVKMDALRYLCMSGYN